MQPAAQVTDIARVIQLAVAPVFLLTAIGTILSVLSGRLARIVDRARVIVGLLAAAEGERRAAAEEAPAGDPDRGGQSSALRSVRPS